MQIVAAASTQEKALRESLPGCSDKAAASKIGELLAERAAAAEVPAVHWVRPKGKRFHGKTAALINSMTAAGLKLNYHTLAAARLV